MLGVYCSDTESERFCRYYQLGWYWHPTPRVDFAIKVLETRGLSTSVWETPQIEAICWLLGVDSFPLPADFDPTIHDLFCTIATFQGIFGENAPSLTDLQRTLKDVAAIKSDLESAMVKISDAPPNINRLAAAFTDIPETIGRAYNSVCQLEHFFAGVVDVPKASAAKFVGSDAADTGRPHNWVAKVVAMKCADIYLTSFGTPPKTDDGHPSFRVFLEKFSQGLPDAMRADKRKLAREVQRLGYSGEDISKRG
ncbi:hypothetical protein [Roseovarius sp.]|uniref:hypothetical protein n=1 Tax=Roseovarius sp. TaxID=1486281 RepID=UPI00261D2E85|nr:hypothetical protein [Roseovarius sp.]